MFQCVFKLLKSLAGIKNERESRLHYIDTYYIDCLIISKLKKDYLIFLKYEEIMERDKTNNIYLLFILYLYTENYKIE